MAPIPAFVLLGPLQMSVDDTPLALGTPKQRAVLAALLIQHNKPVASDSLIHAVWGDDAPTEARASLHAYISNLRRVLRAAGTDADALLAKAPPGYRLSIPDTHIDLARFLHAKTQGLHAATQGHFDDAATHFSDALAEWTGDFLADLTGFQFLEPLAATLHEDKIIVQTARAQAEIACGRSQAVIGDLEHLVTVHPFRESLWAQLMTAYYLTQRQSDALDTYRRLKTTLAAELGIDPDPTLRDLHDRILRQQPLAIARTTKTQAADTIIATARNLTLDSATVPASVLTDTGHTHSLTTPITRIGRQPDNHIVLTDPKVSRHHAVIINTGIGYVLLDSGSVNGVSVNATRIDGSHTLAHGDRITIGHHHLEFHQVQHDQQR